MEKPYKRRPGVIAGSVVVGLLIFTAAAVYQLRAADSAGTSSSLTLDPSLFDGKTRQAYVVAQQHPDLLAQLHCYCGCEQHEGHKSLLDCFRTNHAAGCATCVGEAVMAGQLYDNGTPVDQILATLHERYANGS
jgi:Protein of unknown function with PCYCGC motif